jgi:uncharacterized protein YoxC
MPDTQTLELIFIALVALAMVVQAIALIILSVSVRKSLHSALQQFEELRVKVTPIIDNVQDLVQRLGPKIAAVTDDVTEVAHKVRVQVDDVQATATELVERLRHQAARLDSMASAVFDAVDRVGSFVSDAVSKPLRQLAGVLASARAVVESLRSPVREGNNAPPPHADADKDMFV